jgi:hypothetical protein
MALSGAGCCLPRLGPCGGATVVRTWERDLALLVSLLLTCAGGVDGGLYQHPWLCVSLPDRAAGSGALRARAGGHCTCGEYE